jgi:exosortase F-associated protein
MILNDLACILIIYGLFEQRTYVRLAAWLMLFEMVVLLPLYLAVKLTLEGPTELSSPLLSQIHRLIVNPLLMFVLMAGLLYQKWVFRKTQ